MNKSQLRKELRPDMVTAERLYPLILKRLEEYEAFVDAQREDTPQETFDAEYKKMEQYISELTGKDLSEVWLWEWWEGNGIENFSFELALPTAPKREDFTREELTEVVRILVEQDIPCENDFEEEFQYVLDDYYHQLLKINFKKYKYNYFIAQKDDTFLSVEEIVSKIW